MSQTWTWTEVNAHNDQSDLYLVIEDKVYDVTKFQHEHPGGFEFLLDQGGKDVTELFEDAGHSEVARAMLPKLQIGTIKGQTGRDKHSQTMEVLSSGSVARRQKGLRTYVGILAITATAAVGLGAAMYFGLLGTIID